eukprot:979077-Rhodomonas_salina.3
MPDLSGRGEGEEVDAKRGELRASYASSVPHIAPHQTHTLAQYRTSHRRLIAQCAMPVPDIAMPVPNICTAPYASAVPDIA